MSRPCDCDLFFYECQPRTARVKSGICFVSTKTIMSQTSFASACVQCLNFVQAMSVIQKLYPWSLCQPRVKDYIVKPKPNGYQSLHATQLVPDVTDMTRHGPSVAVEFQVCCLAFSRHPKCCVICPVLGIAFTLCMWNLACYALHKVPCAHAVRFLCEASWDFPDSKNQSCA